MIDARSHRSARSSGIVWYDSGNGVLRSPIDNAFGPRKFNPHVETLGFDYDWHRGIDTQLEEGEQIYAPCGGVVTRLHRSHFGFENNSQLDYWEEDQDGGGSFATFVRSGSNLVITGTRAGEELFPFVPKFKAWPERVGLATNFEMRVKLGAVGALAAGQFGFAVLDEYYGEFVGLEWNGAVATACGRDSDDYMTEHGTTLAVTTETWLRFMMSSGTLYWQVSSNARNWSTVASQAMPAMTSAVKDLVPMLYWRATDVDTPPVEILVDSVAWVDADGIGRFGNWLFLIHGGQSSKFMLAHFRDLAVDVGEVVEAGQALGIAGSTGFDERSGPILDTHSHVEYLPTDSALYDNDEPVNPLSPGVFPRADVSSNVTVTRSTANDPDGVTSWKLRIQVARADSDFDLNSVSLTGNTATRTIDFDTRSGLNSDSDVPKQSGVYIVPDEFDADSPEFVVDVYFNKVILGSTFVSAYVKDTEGVTLWSEVV